MEEGLAVVEVMGWMRRWGAGRIGLLVLGLAGWEVLEVCLGSLLALFSGREEGVDEKRWLEVGA